MNFILQPWQLLLTIFAGLINRQQQEVIDYLRTENQVLKEAHGKKRIGLNDNQRRRLAVKGKILGRKVLSEIGTGFSPDTILRWHRQLVAEKWDFTDRRKSVGRPRVRQEIVDLTVHLARENPSWGYDRIQGALANLGHKLSDTTVANILREHGIEPAPERKRQSTWKEFLEAHWDVLSAIDFTTIEVWTKSRLVTFYLLFVMEVATRRVHLAGCTTSPDEVWMKQVARHLTDPSGGFLIGTRHLLSDRDTKYCAMFRSILDSASVKSVRLPARSPNLNAHSERFMRSLKEECLDRMIFLGETSLRRATSEFLAHYHSERDHQGLHNRLITGGEEVGRTAGRIRCRERLGGMLRYYHGKSRSTSPPPSGPCSRLRPPLDKHASEGQRTARVPSHPPLINQNRHRSVDRTREFTGTWASFGYLHPTDQELKRKGVHPRHSTSHRCRDETNRAAVASCNLLEGRSLRSAGFRHSTGSRWERLS